MATNHTPLISQENEKKANYNPKVVKRAAAALINELQGLMTKKQDFIAPETFMKKQTQIACYCVNDRHSSRYEG